MGLSGYSSVTHSDNMRASIVANGLALIMWIPESIYRKLPAAYVLAGSALIPAFGFSGPSAISTLMLFAAAALTALWRYQHQEKDVAEPVKPSSAERDEWAQRRARRQASMRFD